MLNGSVPEEDGLRPTDHRIGRGAPPESDGVRQPGVYTPGERNVTRSHGPPR